MQLVDWWLTEFAASGSGPSTTELGASINDWMENWNEDPSPFVRQMERNSGARESRAQDYGNDTGG